MHVQLSHVYASLQHGWRSGGHGFDSRAGQKVVAFSE